MMKGSLTCTIIIVFAATLITCNHIAESRNVPQSPCPHLFNYFENQYHEVYGGIKFPNDLSGLFQLEINMSIALVTNRNIVIMRMTSELDTRMGGDMLYYIRFPFNHTLPVLTSVVFNGILYCTGPPERPTVEHGVTTLSATDYFRTSIYPGVKPNMLPSPTMRPTNRNTNDQDYYYNTNGQVQYSLITTTTPAPAVAATVFNRLPINDEFADCGLAQDVTALVVHGKPTRSGQYPWLTAIFHLEEDASYKFRCAGSLVTKRHIITAGHCVQQYKTLVVKKENLVLVLGKHNIKTWAVRSTIRDVKSIYVHPDFNLPGDADLAVLSMSQSVEYTNTLRSVCLWSGDDRLENIVNAKGTVVGWGRDENDDDYVEEPRQIDMPVVTQEECLRSDDRFLKLTSNRTFCAGEKNGAAPCSGDSGGGFLMRRAGRWMLRGVVSVALVDQRTQTCDVNNYVVFADVSKYLTWIHKTLKRP